MDTIIKKCGRFAGDVSDFTSNFSPEAWGAIAVLTVVFGYLMLRGNILKG